MYYTYVVRPGEMGEGRGPQFQPFWDTIMNYNLRGGFLLQLLGYILIITSSFLGGNFVCIFNVLKGSSSALSKAPIYVTFLGCFFWAFGSLWIQNFRSITDDDGSIKESRGFRAGTKLLQHGSLFDLISWAMTCILLFSFMNFFEDTWTRTTLNSGSTALFSLIARAIHALTCVLYGMSFFFLEIFHTQGSGEAWGWLLSFLYAASGCFEFLMLFNIHWLTFLCNFLFSITLGSAVIISLLWAFIYEPIVSSTDVKLTQSAMRIEFFKSRNAVAYYGPPISTEMTPIPSK